MRLSLLLLLVITLAAGPAATAGDSSPKADSSPKYHLQPVLKKGDAVTVSIQLEVGGEIVTRQEEKTVQLPLSVVAQLRYQERLLNWPPLSSLGKAEGVARSLRHYLAASATIKVDQEGIQHQLADRCRTVVAELRDDNLAINGLSSPLTRQELDLIQVVGNSLVLDGLLPGRELGEGDTWDHKAAVLGPLLGMDHVAACEVRSVITGESHNQVQIRLAGTVHGTVDGAATEIELRGAYLFHLQQKRITKFNLALKENRTIGVVAPGLDVVAKLKMEIEPTSDRSRLTDNLVRKVANLSHPVHSDLRYDASKRGYRFMHDTSWYVTAEQREMVSLRRLQQGELTAHCNITTLPPRSAGHDTSLEQFERDVRASLDKNLLNIVAATEWDTTSGYRCLGVIARGTVDEVPVEWRYYLVAEAGKPRVSIAVTVEQARVERFADADRRLVESLELLAPVATASTSNELAR